VSEEVDVLSVECPACRVLIGYGCRDLGKRGSLHGRDVHPSRRKEAKRVAAKRLPDVDVRR
jgi:hypothetical protein